MPRGASACPHCGHTTPKRGLMSRRSAKQADPEDSASRTGPLSPSSAVEIDVSVAEPVSEVELGDEVELPLEEAIAPGGGRPGQDRSVSAPATATPAKRGRAAAAKSKNKEGGKARRRRRKSEPDASGDGSTGAPATGLLPLSAEQLRHMIGEEPQLLEADLRVLGDEGRRQLGMTGGAEIGEVDLLARGADGDWVVVMVVEGSPGPNLVADVLRSVGWVRKHLCEDGDRARAIVLLEGMDEELGYAASAVGDTIAFRTWRVSIEFDPVEV